MNISSYNIMLPIFLLGILITAGPTSLVGVSSAQSSSQNSPEDSSNSNSSNSLTGTVQEELADVQENLTQAAESIGTEVVEIPQEIRQRIDLPDIEVPSVNFPDIDLQVSMLSAFTNLFNLDPDLEQVPAPPPIIGGQRDAPDYTIDIPHSESGENLTYEPREVGVPLGTTIMWINKDVADHTVTTAEQGHEFSPPESFDSGHIPGVRETFVPGAPSVGGSFIYTFDRPGVYEYFCTIHPGHTGRIVVGDTIQFSQNNTMILMEGASFPFTASELSRIVLAVVPSEQVIDLPPTTTIAYNISISGPAPQNNNSAFPNQTGIGPFNNLNQLLYSEQFLDTDGVLYLELIPQPAVNETTSDFITWGPDISASATGPHTGAFHIKGPVLVQNEPYTMTVSIVNIDEQILEEPITEQFILSPQLASPQNE